MKSRLTRKIESERKRRTLITVFGLLIIGFILFQAGIWALTNISGVIIGFNEGREEKEAKRNLKEILSPPRLDAFAPGTDKDTVQISGSAPSSEGTVEIYLNDELYKEIALSSEDFKIQVKGLKEGENKIEARYVEDGRQSTFSNPIFTTYSKEPPKLDIIFPTDGAQFKRGDETIKIIGTTEPANTIKVNDFVAIVDDEGKFSYNLRLSEGDNILTLIAQNPAGAKTEKKIKVTFSP